MTRRAAENLGSPATGTVMPAPLGAEDEAAIEETEDTVRPDSYDALPAGAGFGSAMHQLLEEYPLATWRNPPRRNWS